MLNEERPIEMPNFLVDLSVTDNLDLLSDKQFRKVFTLMIEFAKKLSAPFPFVRVDFYDLHDKLYVGEMTFKSGGGFSKFEPVDWDYRFGEMLDLKKVPKEFIHLQEGFPAETCAGEEN